MCKHNVGTVKRKLYCRITSTATKKFQFHVGDHNLQLKSVRGIVSLYACASNVILTTGFVHGSCLGTSLDISHCD